MAPNTPKTTVDLPFSPEDVKSGTAKQEPIRQSLFLLYYRQGQNPHSQFTMFFGSGSFNQVVASAKSYCETMNLRFVTVKPAIINFEEEVKKLNRGVDY